MTQALQSMESQWYFRTFIIIIILIFLIYKILNTYGFMGLDKPYIDRMRSSTIIYKSYKGAYSSIGGQFELINKRMSRIFSISESFGIYFDDPAKTEKYQTRAVIGIMVNCGEIDKIQQFMAQFGDDYRSVEIPSTKYVGMRFPYTNSLSYLAMVNNAYPHLSTFIKKEELKCFPCFIQIYHFTSENLQQIQIMSPLGSFNFQQLYHQEEQYIVERQQEEQMQQKY